VSKILDEVLQANEKYAASFGDKGKLPLPPARKFAILTCIDARLHPSKYAGLAEGDAHDSAISRAASWTTSRAFATTLWCRSRFRSTARSTTSRAAS
jgi:hypothetical protein